MISFRACSRREFLKTGVPAMSASSSTVVPFARPASAVVPPPSEGDPLASWWFSESPQLQHGQGHRGGRDGGRKGGGGRGGGRSGGRHGGGHARGGRGGKGDARGAAGGGGGGVGGGRAGKGVDAAGAPQLCHFFEKGRCKSGSACQFLHRASAGDRSSPNLQPGRGGILPGPRPARPPVMGVAAGAEAQAGRKRPLSHPPTHGRPAQAPRLGGGGGGSSTGVCYNCNQSGHRARDCPSGGGGSGGGFAPAARTPGCGRGAAAPLPAGGPRPAWKHAGAPQRAALTAAQDEAWRQAAPEQPPGADCARLPGRSRAHCAPSAVSGAAQLPPLPPPPGLGPGQPGSPQERPQDNPINWVHEALQRRGATLHSRFVPEEIGCDGLTFGYRLTGGPRLPEITRRSPEVARGGSDSGVFVACRVIERGVVGLCAMRQSRTRLPISPHISPYLPISPRISPSLPISPRRPLLRRGLRGARLLTPEVR